MMHSNLGWKPSLGIRSATVSLLAISTIGLNSASALAFKGQSAAIAQTTQTAPSYPPQEVNAFMNSCVTSTVNIGIGQDQAQTYCSCTIQEIQNQYTYEQFQQLARQLTQNQPPPELTTIINQCATRAFSET